MIDSLRTRFNEEFSIDKYQNFLDSITKDFDKAPTFRVAETPLFISDDLKEKLLEGSQEVMDFICNPDFKNLTQKAIDLTQDIPGEATHSQFLAIDFGICSENGELIPKLIEVQGFPTIFNFQQNLFKKFVESYPFLSEYTPYLNGQTDKTYLATLRKIVLNGHHPSEVVLLEVEPDLQNTNIDFSYAQRDLGIAIVCVTQVIKRGRLLFYKDSTGSEIQIKRFYNRVILDELNARKDLEIGFDFSDDLEVEWAGHPNWYTRISKFILPYLKGPYFIDSVLLSDLKEIPEDLENYVLKPLFSFSGAGVIFHVTKEDVESVEQRDQFILQKKVNYHPVVQSPDGKVKAEVRMLALWPLDEAKPTLIGNLVRLSRGEMIGVKFNKDKDWVGGTIGLFSS